MTQMKIMRAGMTVSLTSKNKKKASISFPMPLSHPHTGMEDNTQNQRWDKQTMRNTFLLENTLMTVKGFSTRSGLIPINDSSGIKAAINWDKIMMIYEIAIPLKEFYGVNYNADDLEKQLTLSIEVNALEKPDFSSGENRGSSGRGMQGMGGERGERGEKDERGEGSMMNSGGGMRGERNSSNTDREGMFEKGKFSQKFMLAISHKG
jgi:hypothetical protein